MAGTLKTATILFMVFTAAVVAEDDDHDVGGDIGWTIPSKPNFYSDWASGKTFKVGDVLEFNFKTGQHNVATVTKEAYDSCDKAKPSNLIQNGPAKVPLNTTGPHYFICTVGGHCKAGQKLSIKVVGGGGGGGATASPRPNAASSFGGAAVLVIALMSSMVFGLI